ncbi:toxin-antitoxin system HicB family antitoxin [Desulfoprunum benzoelyticum]|uniref:Putative HicB family RNase H-like nuclease n=1 Tax=Desulfoprunum benzoelyticum TaxID=1506996 RepID=A0A840UP84_9BACT|nr:toxin-antitoxin system HicB family antitoxin [Desulfoprunum benzoelyticum]MBB5348067.1 putative HicB family RNase H-like nuclease [Desulfoprunum benzoelyticum]MBM9531581.1 toxin-antitoxin system HicB family antitoxin [Desulfoprunum benzoelyticum]
MMLDAEAYTISIRKEVHDGESYYVGRVAEFPNISSFEGSFEEARATVVDAIQTLKRIADEAGEAFPAPLPIPSDEFSGRVTLRLPKSLHAKVARNAIQEETSLNQYLVTAIASYVGETDGVAKVVAEASKRIAGVMHYVVYNAFEPSRSWLKAGEIMKSEATRTTYHHAHKSWAIVHAEPQIQYAGASK